MEELIWLIMQKEERKFADSAVFEGMTSIRAIIRSFDQGTNDRKIEKENKELNKAVALRKWT